jgi:hypothetical protein
MKVKLSTTHQDEEQAPWLFASIALIVTWALTSAALNLPDFCRSEPLLQCSSSNYNHVHSWLTLFVLVGFINAFLVMKALPFAGWFTLGYALLAGIANRAVRDAMLYVSDVIDATREALGVLFAGHNPYLHVFLTTRPPYSPFPYLPGELLFYGIPYALFHTIDTVDRMVGIATVLLLATLAPLVGPARAALSIALFGTFGLAASTAVDGTNDGGLAFVLIASAVLLAWSEHARHRAFSTAVAVACRYASALFLAWALLFKAIAWPFLPFIVVYMWSVDAVAAKRYLLTVLALCAVATAPFFFPTPQGFIANVYQGFVFHTYFYGMNVWTALQNAGIAVDPTTPFVSYVYVAVVLGVFGALLARPSRSVGEAYARGVAVIVAALLFAHFSTSSYYTFAATVFIAALPLMSASPSRVKKVTA